VNRFRIASVGRVSNPSAAVLLLAALALIGCKTKPAITPVQQTRAEQLATRDDLTLALDGLRKLAQSPDEQAMQRTVFYLNQWLATAKPAAGEWKPDRLTENIPLALKITPGLDRLDELSFQPVDLRYLQANLWAHDIAQRARRTQVPPELAEWLKEIEPQTGVAQTEQLAAAERVFDWVVRNIQLDPLPPLPKGPAATAGANTEPVAPATLGEPGPGYRHLPLDLLIQGHGDAQERARVFILLCRQLQIDAVMLALLEESSPTPRGWLPAVLLGSELYLFDTSLGVPLPGPEGRGIATLAQVVADPKLLRQLDLEGEPAYPVSEKDLRVAALIDAEPEALSRRMQMLQGALPTEQHLLLAVRPSALEPQLRKVKGIGQVGLWRVPFEAVLYSIGRVHLAGSDPAKNLELQLELKTFDPNYALSRGRNLHLQGRFEKVDQELGARNHYLESRTPDQDILALRNSQIVREAQGLQQILPEDPAQQAAMLDAITNIAFTRKHHATYWLGLTYHESGNESAAIEWFVERTLPAVPESPWIPGARYNLARCYEDLGQWDAARKWLESDKDSPQRHGNLLRAKWLAQRHPEAAAAPSANEAAPAKGS